MLRRKILLKVGLVVCAGLVACASGQKPVEAPSQNPSHSFKMLDAGFSGILPVIPMVYLIEVDGCQYVVVARGEGVAITHKANCPNHVYTYKSGQYPSEVVK